MAKIVITSDLTPSGTKITIDDKEVTKDELVARCGFYCSSGEKYEGGGTYKGYTEFSYSLVKEDGTVSSINMHGGSEEYKRIIPIGEINKDLIDSYIGKTTEQPIKDKVWLIDQIVKSCVDKKLYCPPKEELELRTEDSLKDKAKDLFINLE